MHRGVFDRSEISNSERSIAWQFKKNTIGLSPVYSPRMIPGWPGLLDVFPAWWFYCAYL